MIREIRIFERILLCKIGRFNPVRGNNRGGEKVVFSERKKRGQKGKKFDERQRTYALRSILQHHSD